MNDEGYMHTYIRYTYRHNTFAWPKDLRPILIFVIYSYELSDEIENNKTHKTILCACLDSSASGKSIENMKEK